MINIRRSPFAWLKEAILRTGCLMGWLLVLALPVRAEGTHPITSDAWNLTPLGDAHFSAAHLPGGFRAVIDGSGFTLRDPAHEQEVRFGVLHCGRGAGQPLPWRSGPPQLAASEVYFPGQDMGVHYQQSAAGLRQNFMVFTSPLGDGPLHVDVALSGDLVPTLEGTDALHFSDTCGNTRFDYRDLHCWDALNTPLNAHFQLMPSATGHILRIIVDDEAARYPITIDPVSTTPNALLVGVLAGGEFGISVATAGDLNGDGRSDVVVGAWQQTVGGLSQAGAAYVYYGTNAGISTVPSIILTSGQTGAQFGNSVSTAGDVNGDGYSDLLVGSRTWESNVSTELSEGAVFVYYGSATGISTAANLILQTDHMDDNFGSNVACAGDINNDGFSDVIIGAYLSSYPTFNEGSAFIHMGSAAGLNPVATHRLERNQGASFFGRSVAGAGDINGDGFSDVLVGASKWVYTVGASDQGSAFVYYGSAIGLGAGLNPPPALQLFGSGSNVAFYGWWVTCAGDLNGDGFSDIAVSAYQDEIGGQTDEGVVYVYQGSAAGLVVAPVALLQSNQNTAWIGRSASSAGDVNGDGYGDLIVGIPRFTSPESLEGVAQLFLGSATGISTTASFQFELNTAGANLGESVCTAGDVNGDGYSDVIVGARIYGLGGGAAVFLGGPYSTNLVATNSGFGGAAGALQGACVANAGDVNGDGYTDALIGAPGASNGQAGEGLAYLHYGSATGIPVAPSLTLEANVAGAQFGASVSSAGDVNGDGYADVLIGAPLNGAGITYLYLGSAGGLVPAPNTTRSAGGLFGSTVAPAGDVNHDGYGDIIIGSPGTGEAYVYKGSIGGLMLAPHVVLSEPPAAGLFGCSVATAGDVNGDGYSDVIVGARNATNGQANEGLAYVYHGSMTGLVTPFARRLEANLAGADFGVSVAGAGDVNGDGFFDVVVGADLWESGQIDEGAAFIYHGSVSGTSAVASVTLQRNIVDGRFGRSVAEAGDVNGDGYADIIVGAPLAENPAGTADEGLAYVFRGSTAGIAAAGFDQLESNVAGYQFGASVGGAGDLDGDGYSDVLVGAPNANPVLASQGGHYWFRGGVNRALNRLSRQYNADLVSPLSTNSQDFGNGSFFGIGHRARSPIQRCRTKLRWEVVFEGVPFTGLPITNSVTQTGTSAAWTVLPLAGVEIKQLVLKPIGYLRYKWRVRVEYDLAKLIDGQRFSRWFYGFANGIGDIGILPIELIRFTGSAAGPANQLSWTTATELRSERFDVLRSTVGSSFSPIGSVAAAGESQSLLDYSFIDRTPPLSLAYYQLRMVDSDGSEELSDVIAISRDQGLVSVFPNPADDRTIVIIGEQRTGATLVLLDTEGRTLRNYAIERGSSTQDIDLNGLAAGSYNLLLRDPEGAVISALPLIKR
jgi:FG-GAP-like repeat/FG-GAP repeat